ncbi:DUF4249 family protein [Marivirga salinae]|uniref:DUF4249 family protein n=1 Tax=Marivirga salinarum TaxID=3059078 RepID=A0AA51ND30_9BACT|nr:DUF4249 family protein [Marivirga sp. BDSF4-3]WMN11380.1 DUF4249 family protein [Marivirga sp. BDSF4-3]
MINLNKLTGFLCIAIPLLFFACERPLDYDFEVEEIKPVLFVSLNNNGVSYARLTYSALIKGEFKTNRAIEDADIQLHDTDGHLTSFIEEGEGNYSLEYDFEISNSYLIKVNTPYGEVESDLVYFYKAPQVNSITLSNYTKSDPPQSNDAWLLNLNLFIDEEIPYYSFRVKGIIDGEPTEELSSAWSIQSDETDGPCTLAYQFTNECYKNQSVDYPLRVAKYTSNFPIEAENIYEGYIVEMISINESGYEAGFYNFEYEFIDLVFSEPAPHYSNVNGGYGVVEAINITRNTVMVED